MRYHLKRFTEEEKMSVKIQEYCYSEEYIKDKLDIFLGHVGIVAMEFMEELHKHERIVGYGATAKSSTILGLAGVHASSIECIYDNTPSKIGKFTPLSHIPIRDAALFKDDPAGRVVLFPWNHANEIITRENTIRERRWLVYVPQVRWL